MTASISPPVKPLAGTKRIAVVGAGYFSQFHLAGWAQVPGAQVVALCDSDPTKAAILAQRFGVTNVYGSLQEMLVDASPDIVDVVTPPASQAALLDVLLPLGLPVICQKPFGMNFAEAQAFVRAATAHGTPLIVHENFRFMPWFRQARRLIDAGRLGELHGISFRLRPGDGQGPQAYLDRQPYFQTMPRLLVAETAIHFIDTFRFLVGEVESVYAQLRQLNPAIAGEDAGLITFEFAGGAAGLFDGNRLNDHPAGNPRRTMGEMWLEGSEGVLRLDGEARLWWKPHHALEREYVYDRGPEDVFGGGACGSLQKHVVDALEQHLPFENTAQDYLRNLLIQEAVYASHASGRRIVIDAFAPATVSSPPPFPPRHPSPGPRPALAPSLSRR
jgi:D-apiose dehydrogenase